MTHTKRRTPCLVPFCNRSTARLELGGEWLCADHYRHVDKELKALRKRLRQRRKDPERTAKADWVVWQKMKRQAIERAFGIRA